MRQTFFITLYISISYFLTIKEYSGSGRSARPARQIVRICIPSISYTASQNLPPTYDSLKHENLNTESIEIHLDDKSLPQYDTFIMQKKTNSSFSLNEEIQDQTNDRVEANQEERIN